MLHQFEIVSNPYEHLQHLQWNDKLAVAVSLETVKNGDFISKLNLFCFNDPNRIYEYPLKILAKKHFAHMMKLNRFLEMASESGLIVKWLKGFNFDVSEKQPLYEYVVVELETFLVLVVITACFHILAFLVVILERRAYMKIHTKTDTPTWRIIDKTINPNRYYLMENLYDINMKND